MLIKEIHDNEDLTYDIFIDKGIKLIDKVHILIKQYDLIENNTEILIKKIKNKIEIIDIKKDDFSKSDTDFKYKNTKNDKDIMKDIMDKLHILDIYLNNYIEFFKNNIYYVYLQIKEIYKNSKYYNKEFFIYYKNEIEEIDKLFSIYKKIKIDDQIDELFKHIINISNNYILVRKIILCISIIIKIGELLKVENKKLRMVYENL